MVTFLSMAIVPATFKLVAGS